MGAPPVTLGRCDACLFYDVGVAGPTGNGWCRVQPPVRLVAHQPLPTAGLSQQDTRRGAWPLVLAGDWCGAYRSPNALPTEIALDPAAVVRNTGLITLHVYAESQGTFLAGDVIRFDGIDQATTLVSVTHLTAPIDTNRLAGNYGVRVARATPAAITNVKLFAIT
jgi:hypothetical protein